jgi:predicted DNA-binding protein (MmcQ/YjbR family)
MYKSPHWIYILLDGGVPDDEFFRQIDHSYDLIFKALPKKTRERLYINEDEPKTGALDLC